MTLLLLATLAACELFSPPPPVYEAPSPRPALPLPSKQVDAEGLRALTTMPKSRPRVYAFWATWCAPCIAEFPVLKSFAVQHPQVDVVMVNVDSLAVQSARVPALVSRHGLQDLDHVWLVSSDPNASLKAAIQGWPEQIPTALVVRADGTREAMHVEAIDAAVLASSVRAASQASPKQP